MHFTFSYDNSAFPDSIFATGIMKNDYLKDKILSARESLGLTQKEIAEKMGISLSTYKRFEEGKTNLFSRHFEKFETLTGVSPESLIYRQPDREHYGSYLSEPDNREQGIRAVIRDYEQRIKLKDKDIRNLLNELESKDRYISSLEDIIGNRSGQVAKND